ncbi:MAG TPA: SDR family oxidoreductase [Burkholderiales bacterium]|nr:SDR family oxidoreductase [Burkholderiales bacterium]
MRLQTKTCLITGGGAGIGAATAKIFRQEGAKVYVVDANAGEGVDFAGDVADPSLAEEFLKKVEKLDVLVCNAAMRNYSALADATPEEWQKVVAVNLLGAANYVRAALPLLRKSGKGSIVLVSSVYGVAGRKGMGLYDATKAGLLAMARTLAHEEAAHGIRANAVCPGSTLTDFHINKARAAGKDVEKLKRERDDTSLIGRWAAPEEVAWPILWLASDEASFITGATLMVDGGLSIK